MNGIQTKMLPVTAMYGQSMSQVQVQEICKMEIQAGLFANVPQRAWIVVVNDRYSVNIVWIKVSGFGGWGLKAWRSINTIRALQRQVLKTLKQDWRRLEK